MANTTIQEVIDSFESSFADKRVIPYDLEIVWLKKAVARYSIELDPITLDYDTEIKNIIVCKNTYVIS